MNLGTEFLRYVFQPALKNTHLEGIEPLDIPLVQFSAIVCQPS
jgi:hypothetical protein